MATRRAFKSTKAIYSATILALCLSICSVLAEDAQRWSRQISNTNFLNDWVPVQPRQPSGRVLNFGPPPFQQPQQQSQGQYNPQGNIFQNNVPQAPAGVSYATDPFQHPHRLMFHQGQPVQFVQQNIPPQGNAPVQQFLVNGVYQPMMVHAPQQQVIQHTQPQVVQLPQNEEQQQNFQYQHFGPAVPQTLPQQQAHASFLGDVSPPVQPHTEQLIQNVQSVPQLNNNAVDRPGSGKQQASASVKDQEEVQLLYVPLDTLYQQQREKNKIQSTKYSVLPPPVNPLQINNLYAGQSVTASPLGSPSTYKSTRASQPTQSSHRFSTPTYNEFTQSSSRLKPHQPPLAMFMLNDGSTRSRTSVSDVLNTLANANTIDVLDSASKKAPKVFVGPSGLRTPEGYTKFDLPYLSNIEQTRLERQIDKLPFFVAPLSYRAPKGFAKIPLPAPHVGSVVVNSIPGDNSKEQQYQSTKNYYTDAQGSQYFTTPKNNAQYITFPSASPIPNSQIRTTTSGYTPPKYNFGFSFGSDVFTTTPKPQYSSQDEYFGTSTPSYGSKDADFNRYKSSSVSSTKQPQRSQENSYNTRPTQHSSGSVPLFHSSQEQPTQSPTDNSYSPQQNTEFFSNYKPLSQSQNINEEYFNVNKNAPSFLLNNFPSNSNASAISTQVFNTNDDVSPSVGSYVNHYHQPTQATRDYYNLPVATTQRTPTPIKYSFPGSAFEDAATTQKPRYTTQRSSDLSTPTPISNDYSTRAEEISKMKSYYKEQDAFRSRPQSQLSTSPPAQVYETDSYDNMAYNPSSTPSFLQETVLYNRNRVSTSTEGYVRPNQPTTPRTTFTYYTASSSDDEDMGPVQPAVHQYKYVDSVVRDNDYGSPTTRTKTDFTKTYNNQFQNQDTKPADEPIKYKTFDHFYRQTSKTQDDYSSPVTTTPYYESTRNDYRGETINQQQSDEYTSPKPYHLPSELPPISPNLPGLVNALMDKTKGASSSVLASTSTTPIPTTRRGVTRGRRPQTNRTTTSTEDVSLLDATTKRTIPRGRRPVTYGANRTTTPRTPVTRNSNRVRYNPTPEERARFRTRSRNSNRINKEEENIDYQRDVLKQNYPVISRDERPTTTSSTTPRQTTYPDTAVSYGHESERTVEAPASESPNGIPEHFSTLQDQMQIPQEYQGLSKEIDIHELNNYPPVYFSRDPQPQDVQSQENQSVEPQEEITDRTERTVFISPTTQSTGQTEANLEQITEVLRTRRPSFIRRAQSTTAITTTQPPTTTQEYEAAKTKEKYPSRTKTRYETNSSQTRLKNRIRGRRPTTEAPITTTVAAAEEEQTSDKSFRKINRFNKDFYKDYSHSKRPVKEASVRATVSPVQEQKKVYFERQPYRFSLDTEESQWSSKLGQNSFQPLDPEDKPKSSENGADIEIVTAGSNDDSNTQETYSFNVAAKNVFGYNGDNAESSTKLDQLPESSSPTSTSESSIAELIKAAISDFSNDIPSNASESDEQNEESDDGKSTTKSTLETTSTKAKTDLSDKKSKRRGVWKRVRVRPIDGFETAESQNIGKQIYNTILSDNSKEQGDKVNFEKGAGSNSYQSYDLSEETQGFVDESNGEATGIPFPGDVDLGTGAPIDSSDNGTAFDNVKTTTEKIDVVTTLVPELTTIIEDDKEATIVPTEEAAGVHNAIKMETVTTTPAPTTTILAWSEIEKELQTETSNQGDDQPHWTESSDSSSMESGDAEDYADMKSEWTRDDESLTENENNEPINKGDDAQSSSIMDEVKQKLSSLFSFPEEQTAEKDLVINKNFKRTRQPSYTTIERTRSASSANELEGNEANKESPMKLLPVPVQKTILHPVTEASTAFHRDLMDSVIYATSTSTEISHETEICYRGRCVKSLRKP